MTDEKIPTENYLIGASALAAIGGGGHIAYKHRWTPRSLDEVLNQVCNLLPGNLQTLELTQIGMYAGFAGAAVLIYKALKND